MCVQAMAELGPWISEGNLFKRTRQGFKNRKLGGQNF